MMESLNRSTDILRFEYFFHICTREIFFWCNSVHVYILRSYSPKSTIGAANNTKCTSLVMKFQFLLYPNAVIISVTSIISYLLSTYSSASNSHVTSLIELNYGRDNPPL